MNDKYEITPEGRVRALRDFGDVRAGDIGGFVDSEENLSHDGLCWVSGKAKVCGNADVCRHSSISGETVLRG
jgi:hypothetical protein